MNSHLLLKSFKDSLSRLNIALGELLYFHIYAIYLVAIIIIIYLFVVICYCFSDAKSKAINRSKDRLMIEAKDKAIANY